MVEMDENIHIPTYETLRWITLLSLLSDCGPDTPDSSIKEEPSEEASEVIEFYP